MRQLTVLATALCLFLLAPDLALAQSCHRMAPLEADDAGGKVSRFGAYHGYSTAIYDSWVRRSLYVAVRDGGQLATDVMIPALDCQAAEQPLPVLVTFTPYKRAYLQPDGSVLSAVEDQGAELLVRHGYVIVAVAIRGTAASYGRYRGLFSPSEAKDAYDVLQWLAAQPWSDGNIGMVGGSYQGITQLTLAALDPPALKAIFPLVSLFDFYESVYPGGIFRSMPWDYWAQLRHNLDIVQPSVPVDGDEKGERLAVARAQHADNPDIMAQLRAVPFRDDDRPAFSWSANNPAAQLAAINRAKIPMYISDGWNDVFTADVLFWYENYAGPKRMMIGPWTHNSKHDPRAVVEERGRLTTIEELRWFDYWLKGIDNGIMDQDPINYSVLTGRHMAHVWHQSAAWPPPDVGPRVYYFRDDGALALDQPEATRAYDSYELDYTTTTGANSRWNIFFGTTTYPDMSVNDAKSLTYTSPPLDSAAAVIGFPVVTLYVSSTANDGDFHVVLERVDGAGVSHHVTDGMLRASQRKLSVPPWKNFGLPFQAHTRADVRTLVPGEVAELKFYLPPTATTFHRGDRIRVAVMGADADNTETLIFQETPTIRLYRDRAHSSQILLPIRR